MFFNYFATKFANIGILLVVRFSIPHHLRFQGLLFLFYL